MTIASIDLGSNTVILLIARYNKNASTLKFFRNEYRVPRISENVKLNGIIMKNSLERLMSVLDEYKLIIEQYNADIVLVNATNAFRIAGNGDEIKSLLELKYGWKINIISGDEEARLTFLGVVFPIYDKEDVSIIDIGGGSTEIVYGNIKKILFKKSFPIGIVSLFEQFIKSEIPSDLELKHVREEICDAFAELKNVISPGVKSIAVAGTPTSLSAIQKGIKNYDDDLIENSLLNLNQINKIIGELKQLTPIQIKNKFGNVIAGREDLILIGSIILEEFMKMIKIEDIIVSSKGLRYGAVSDYLMKQGIQLNK